MPFVHPAIFWTGLAAVSAPILIHLLNRRRFRVRYWAAMQFLLESLRRNRRRLRIEELILLALRCLIVLALALAVGRLTGCVPASVLPGGAGPGTTVFVLDDSVSMGQKVGESDLFRLAKRDLIERVRRLPKSERVAILLASQGKSEDPFFDLNFVTDPVSLAARIENLSVSDRRATLSATLARVAESLGRVEGPAQVFLLTDCRRADLTASEEVSALRREFQRLEASGAKLHVLDYGRDARDNLTIESVELVDRFAVAKVPFRLSAVVRNHSPSGAENVEVSIRCQLAGSRQEEEEQIVLPVQVIRSVEPGQTGRVEFEVTCPQPGAAVITAALLGDELPGDNKAHLALDVRDAVQMLIVDGAPDLADPEASESFFLSLIVDPTGDAYYRVRPEVVAADSLGGVTFGDYDLVVLLNVGDFPVHFGADGKTTVYPQLEALEKFVREGGGVAIFTGDRVNLDFYNGPLYANGAGLSPFPIATRRGDPARKSQFVRLAPASLAPHDVLRIFHSFAAQGADVTGLVRFYAFTPAREAETPATAADIRPPQVLARFADPQNSPAIAARAFGRGRVVMFYTTADKDWNDWPIDPVGTYGSVIHDTIRYLARPQRPGMTALVAEAISFDLRGDLLDGQATLKTPAYPAADVISLVAARQGSTGRLTYGPAMRAGVYTLAIALPDGTTRRILFARNVDPAEGNLSWGGQGALHAAFGSDRFSYVRRLSLESADPVRKRPENEYWMYAIAAMLVLLAAEVFLAQRFGHYGQR